MTDWLNLSDDEERAIGAFMLRVASLQFPNPDSRIADPARLWWKAQLLRKWEAERRAQLPLDIIHSIEVAGSLAAAGVMVYLSLPYLF